MPDQQRFDTRFSLPAIDDAPTTEIGVILMGLDAERLLAGLGLATMADDAALVALTVDHLRHGAPHPVAFDTTITAGASRWRSARAALAAADQGSTPAASPRQTWERTLRLLSAADVGETGPAARTYLVACWLRRDEVDRCAASRTED